jgi:uncharacterized OB-fold protein
MADGPDNSVEVLSAPLVIEFPFSRTVGPVQSAFLTGLREGIMVGVRRSDGTVLVPPVEYDPETADELTELVEVGSAGEVTTWAWISEPRPNQPLNHAFAWALIKLDGADTPMMHAVDTGDESVMATGMRVQVRWRDERVGMITDIECFEPEAT